MPACVTDTCTSFLDFIVQTFLPEFLVNFLNTTLIRIPYFVLNLWTFVHIGAGVLFFYIWKRYSNNVTLGFWIWFCFNIIFELFEYTMARAGLYQELFFEELADVAWDLVANQIGFIIAYYGAGRCKYGQGK